MELTPEFLEAEDYGILTVFPKLKPEDYNGSSFLKNTLCNLDVSLPELFFVICPYGTGKHENRNFNPQDWSIVVDFLKKRNLTGIILNDRIQSVAIHDNLVDLSGKTSLLEAIEILKRAAGYIGVDSSLSVLAAKLFATENIVIKTTNMHVTQWQRVYYAPQTTFNFLELAV